MEKGANIEAMTTSHGATPLDSAAWNGHADVVGLLLEKGANIEAMTTCDGATPLDSAAWNGHADVVRLLLEKGANIEAMRRGDGSRPLYNASWRGHVGIVCLLLEMGANIESIRIDDGRTALHTVAWYLQAEVVRLLLENGANIHATSKKAATALHYVFLDPIASHGFKDSKQLIPTITVLLAYGANILQNDNMGKTPLDLAEAGGHLEAKQLFRQHLKERNLKPPRKFR